jgi:hypothetical protein
MAYIYDLTDTWSAGGTVFNAIKMNVTDSASAVASKLVSLQTNGTEHFSVTKAGAGYFSGNVGIGVTPLANTRIYVRTATVTDTAYYADNGANSGFKVKFASSLTSILNDFGADLVLGTNDTERMRITAAGGLAVGTTTDPGAGNIGLAAGKFLRFSSTAYMTPEDNVAGARIVTPGAFNLATGGTAVRMIVDGSGNVGIGTSSPGAKLDVLVADGAEATKLRGATGRTRIRPYVDATNGSFIDAVNTAENAYIPLSLAGSSIRLTTSAGLAATIDASGNVGIGTTTPTAGYRLDVSGSANASGSFVSGGGTTSQAAIGNKTLSFYNTGSGDGLIKSDDDTSSFTSIALNKTEVKLFTANTERMRIDGSGNVLMGKTASNFDTTGVEYLASSKILRSTTSSNAALQLQRTTTDGDVIQFWNAGSLASSISLVGTNAFLGATGLLAFSAGGAERMRIDANGNLLVGVTTSPGSPNAQIVAGGTADAGIQLASTNGGGGLILAPGGAGTAFYTYTGAVGSESYSERMRIDSSGNLLVGTTAIGAIGTVNGFRARPDGRSLISSATDGVLEVGYNGGNATGTVVSFYKGGALGGSITTDGSTTAYNTSSDVRLKHDIVDAPEASSLIDALQVRSFKWNADNSEQRYGMVAQELAAVAPEAVSQPEDPDAMMGVDYSKLVPMLVKEIQSLRARVAQLEGTA